MKRTFKYYLKLTNYQKQQLDQVLSDCNFVYNFILKGFKNRDKNGIKQPTEYQLIKSLVEIKKDHPHLKRTHAGVLQDVIKRVYKTWKTYELDKRLGLVKGYPRFKPIHRYNSFVYPKSFEEGDCGYKIDNSPLNKKRENRKLKIALGNQNHHRVYLELRLVMERNFNGIGKTLTIERKNERYYALFSCEEVKQNLLPKIDKKVGLDLGITTLIATSDGKKFKNPKFYKQSEMIIKKVQQSLSKKVKGSQNWLDAKFQLVKKWEKVVNQFKHYSYQISNELVGDYDKIAVENLDVKGMLEKKLGDKKRSLRRNLLGVKFGILLKVMTDKVEETGRSLVLVDPKNTSQICSNCGELAKIKLSLKDRIFECKYCKLKLNRNVNSARNVLLRAENRFDKSLPLKKGKEF